MYTYFYLVHVFSFRVCKPLVNKAVNMKDAIEMVTDKNIL